MSAEKNRSGGGRDAVTVGRGNDDRWHAGDPDPLCGVPWAGQRSKPRSPEAAYHVLRTYVRACDTCLGRLADYVNPSDGPSA